MDPKQFSLMVECLQKDATVWDIGGNVGIFAFGAAHLVGPKGRVYVIEPDAWLVQLLRKSVLCQPATSAPVTVIQTAIVRTMGLRTFHIARRSRSANFLEGYGTVSAGGVAERQTVVAVTLDWLAEQLPLPDLIKIDVEGAELEVLLGGEKLFVTRRPVLLCEVGSASSAEVTRFLKGKGYRIYDGDAPAGERQEVAMAPWNTIAIPSEKR